MLWSRHSGADNMSMLTKLVLVEELERDSAELARLRQRVSELDREVGELVADRDFLRGELQASEDGSGITNVTEQLQAQIAVERESREHAQAQVERLRGAVPLLRDLAVCPFCHESMECEDSEFGCEHHVEPWRWRALRAARAAMAGEGKGE